MFLGMLGWRGLWMADYGLLVKPLYGLLNKSTGQHPERSQIEKEAFKKVEQSLMMAPALGLPDVEKPFELFVCEKEAITWGVLAQRLGAFKRPVAYFSKQLDNTSKDWPGCLRAVAATVLIIQEARKFTLGQRITIYVPHIVSTMLEQKGGYWLSLSRMLKYQAILVEQDDIELKTTSLVNPASFLNTRKPAKQLHHDYLKTIKEVYSSCPDLKEHPLSNADLTLYTDESSYVQNGKRVAGYAVVTLEEVLEASPLPSKTSAQKAELIALTKALEIGKGKAANIWTDSKYAFGVVHTHSAVWKERELLTAKKTTVKHAQ